MIRSLVQCLRSPAFLTYCCSNTMNTTIRRSMSTKNNYWRGLIAKINESKTSDGYPTFENEGEDVLPEVKKVRNVLVNSRQPGKAIGDFHILPETLAEDFRSFYKRLDSQSKKVEVFTILAKEFGVNHGHIRALAHDIVDSRSRGIDTELKLEEQLHVSIEPPYIILLTHVGRNDGGVKFIVDLRKDLLDILSNRRIDYDRSELLAVNHHIRLLLSMWFSVGFFNLERITWQSPCDITEKLASYEAVHPIKGWLDLKQRIGPYRRCYVFMHPSMPREPVSVLHVALRKEIPQNIQEILSESTSSDEVEDEVEDRNSAVFYSISSTQKGLAEIDLGNSLIKEAVDRLRHDLPNIQTFVTLSPIPGFRQWLDRELLDPDASVITDIMENGALSEEEKQILKESLKEPYDTNLKALLGSYSWLSNKAVGDILKISLMQICAKYLYHEKRRGFAYDPVANFHLRNGAIIWRLNWAADTSSNGLQNSYGIMVNYRYILDQLDYNTSRYLMTGNVSCSSEFKALLPTTELQVAS